MSFAEWMIAWAYTIGSILIVTGMVKLYFISKNNRYLGDCVDNILTFTPDYKKSRDAYDKELERLKDKVLNQMGIDDNETSVLVRIIVLYHLEYMIGAQLDSFASVVQATNLALSESDLAELCKLNQRYQLDLERFLNSKNTEV
jgi:hypothetical protein